MVTSVKNLKTQIDSRLAGGGLTALECCQLDNASGILANNIVHKVANSASLPNVTLNEGRFVYLDDINEYRFSDGTQWTNDYDTTRSTISTQLWAWGCNLCGVVGDGTTTNRCSPVREISSATDWCQVSASLENFLTAAIKTSGQLWSWGRNNNGEIGDGTTTSRCSPVREFCSATDWCQVSVGRLQTTAIKATLKGFNES